jgi:hypothetical protein
MEKLWKTPYIVPFGGVKYTKYVQGVDKDCHLGAIFSGVQ